MEEKNIDNELFNPEEMQSPFESIKEVDAEGHEWRSAIVHSYSKNSNSLGQMG